MPCASVWLKPPRARYPNRAERVHVLRKRVIVGMSTQLMADTNEQHAPRVPAHTRVHEQAHSA
eukprot:6822164-Alexandrium_andersonii.AAC.1